MQNKIIFIVFTLLFSVSVIASQISFTDYQVSEIYNGGNHSINEPSSGNDNVDEMRIKISKLPPNFAGHYTIYTFGCGGGARCGEIYDVKTGVVVTGLPNSYLDDDFDLSFKKNSSLVIISGVTADTEYDKKNIKIKSAYRDRYYNFNGERLELISEK